MTNEALVEWMGANVRPRWIAHRTGILKRHWAMEGESCSDLATSACRNLIEKKGLDRERISQLVVGTISGDYLTPPTAPLVQEKLRLDHHSVGVFDLGAACAGFVTGLHVCAALAEGLKSDHLFVASDIRSKFLSKKDLSATALFGDGAASVLISPDSRGADFRFVASELLSDGSVDDMISIRAGGSKQPAHSAENPDDHFLKMKKGVTLFVKAAAGMVDSIHSFLNKMEMEEKDIQWFVPHQANLHLVDAVAEKLQCSQESVVKTVSFTGNTAGGRTGGHLSVGETLRKQYGRGVFSSLGSGAGSGDIISLTDLDFRASLALPVGVCIP